MIRNILCGLSTRLLVDKSSQYGKKALILTSSHLKSPTATFTSLIPPTAATQNAFQIMTGFAQSIFLRPKEIQTEQIRTVVKFSWGKGSRKSVKAVRTRFFRLNWGIWIRTIAGRYRKRWKKSPKRLRNSLDHVFCNATQSRMLDKMVNKYWRRPKYYIEDPYEPYLNRENFRYTKTKPWRPEGCDYE